MNSTTLQAYAKPGLNRALRLRYLVAAGLEGAVTGPRARMMTAQKWQGLFPGYAAWEAALAGGAV